MRVSPEVIESLAMCKKQLPAIEGWLTDWRDRELALLPCVIQNTALAQGRCQVLNEICKLVNQSPDLVQQNSVSS